MTLAKKVLIGCWVAIIVLVGLIIYWHSLKNDQGIVTSKARNIDNRNILLIVLDNSRYYQFPNLSDWAKIKEQTTIRISYQEASIFPIFIPTIESYEIIKKPPQ